MIVVMSPTATEEDIAAVVEVIEDQGGETFVSRGKHRTLVGLVGDTERFMALPLPGMPGVEQVIRVGKPYKLVAAESRSTPSAVAVGPVTIGRDRFCIIAGPCAIETEDQAMTSARAAKAAGAHVLRGDAYKHRTSPYAFQGLAKKGLEILAQMRTETGLPVVTEVLQTSDVEVVASYADIIRIGARNMQNFQLLREVGRMGRPVMLKRGLSATIEEWLMAAEYIAQQGNEDIILCERGIRTFEPMTRNTLDVSAVPLVHKLSHLPIIIDPSHSSGKRELVAPLALAAAAVGADGVMIDIHPHPESALCDGPQALTTEELPPLVEEMTKVAHAVGRSLARPSRGLSAVGE
ncbi:MAG TPA: 3-deoxy-7-phosphoheptulonate synthase [Actinomycetota bacterium]|nr:3-deoxy-7-phosphoheptulonate synthase [Actinomycetota bacterium]